MEDHNIRWSALTSRSPSADGKFVYAVKTTRIFCRPICKARLARRSNVEFFDTPALAQAAGYRACKRCQPLLATYTPEADKVKKAVDMLDSLPQDAPLPGLERLAKEAGLTKHHFHRLFKRETGMTPRQYALSAQSMRGSEPSASSEATPITPITTFMSETQTPAMNGEDDFPFDFEVPVFANDVKDQALVDFRLPLIYYDIMETTYGHLLVGFQDEQICKIELGTSEVELLQSLVAAFPGPRYVHLPIAMASDEDTEAYNHLCAAVVEALVNPTGKVLDVSMSFSPGVQDAIT